MANTAWKTNDDIVHYLSTVTGGFVDENFIVRGYRPPPPLRSNEDEEMRLLFGDDYTNSRAQVASDADGSRPPDLRGIRQMLQMVNDYEDGTKDTAASSADLVSPEDVITISKLNPHVQEFVPKSLSGSGAEVEPTTDRPTPSAHSLSVIAPDASAHSTSDQTPRVAADKPVAMESDQPAANNAETKVIPNKNLYSHNSNNEDIKKLSESLKSKISNASKSDTFQSKREKNVAIATLLKLHAARVDKENEPSYTKPVLLPPDYYMNKHPPQMKAEKEADAVFETLPSSSALAEDSSLNNTFNISNATLNNVSQTASESTSEPYDADKEIQSSIDKVNKWLNPTTTTQDKAENVKTRSTPKASEKKVISILGPITFKKKEIKTQSPVESKGSTTPKKTKRDSKEFVPSDKALKQSEEYMRRIKERELKEQRENSKVTLANLEERLKARDEKLRSTLNSSFTNSSTS